VCIRDEACSARVYELTKNKEAVEAAGVLSYHALSKQLRAKKVLF
jgi:hypothetical protein